MVLVVWVVALWAVSLTMLFASSRQQRALVRRSSREPYPALISSLAILTNLSAPCCDHQERAGGP